MIPETTTCSNPKSADDLLDLSISLINMSVAETPLGEAFNIIASMADESHLFQVEASGDDCLVEQLETPMESLEKDIDAFWQDEGLEMFATPISDDNPKDDICQDEDPKDDLMELWGQEELNSVDVDNLMISMKEVMEDDIVCEYARSSRSSCKICGNKIEKNVLRFGKIMELQNRKTQNILSPYWSHPTCFYSLNEGFQDRAKVKGLENLSGEDREAVSLKLFQPELIPCIENSFKQNCLLSSKIR